MRHQPSYFQDDIAKTINIIIDKDEIRDAVSLEVDFIRVAAIVGNYADPEDIFTDSQLREWAEKNYNPARPTEFELKLLELVKVYFGTPEEA